MKLPRAYEKILQLRKNREDQSSKKGNLTPAVLKLLTAIETAQKNSRSIKWSGLDKRTIDLHEWQAIVKAAQAIS